MVPDLHRSLRTTAIGLRSRFAAYLNLFLPFRVIGCWPVVTCQEACTAWQAKLTDIIGAEATRPDDVWSCVFWHPPFSWTIPPSRRLDPGLADTSGVLQPHLMPSGGRQLATADTLPAMQMLGSVTVTVGDATCSVTVAILVGAVLHD